MDNSTEAWELQVNQKWHKKWLKLKAFAPNLF